MNKIIKSTEIKIPSNKKFGYFFSAVFLIVSSYFFYSYSTNQIFGYVFGIISLVFFITTLINPELLLPLNKVWMKLGLILGMVISPIVLGIIFFGLLTPYGVIMRFFGRDELHLKIIINKSKWINRKMKSSQCNFKYQF